MGRQRNEPYRGFPSTVTPVLSHERAPATYCSLLSWWAIANTFCKKRNAQQASVSGVCNIANCYSNSSWSILVVNPLMFNKTVAITEILLQMQKNIYALRQRQDCCCYESHLSTNPIVGSVSSFKRNLQLKSVEHVSV